VLKYGDLTARGRAGGLAGEKTDAALAITSEVKNKIFFGKEIIVKSKEGVGSWLPGLTSGLTCNERGGVVKGESCRKLYHY
jgi:hypothetical protein